MKVKVGDNVLVIAGADKGKTGKVIKTLRKENRVIVEGVHMIKRHMKGRYVGSEKGQIINCEAPIHVSNVKIVNEGLKQLKKVKGGEE